MGLAYDGLLGLHILFALLWIATTFIGLYALFGAIKSPGNSALLRRAMTMNRLIAAFGGLTVLIGIGFFYYVDVYRKSYAPSASGLPLIEAGAALGAIVFIWQMVMGPRIRNALKSSVATAASPSASAPPAPNSKPAIANMPSKWMSIVPAILLILAFLLMLGGTSM